MAAVAPQLRETKSACSSAVRLTRWAAPWQPTLVRTLVQKKLNRVKRGPEGSKPDWNHLFPDCLRGPALWRQIHCPSLYGRRSDRDHWPCSHIPDWKQHVLHSINLCQRCPFHHPGNGLFYLCDPRRSLRNGSKIPGWILPGSVFGFLPACFASPSRGFLRMHF